MAESSLQNDAGPVAGASTPPRSGPAPVDINALVRERFGVDIGEFSGTRISGEIPLSDDLVNRLIGQRFVDHPHISSIRIQPQEGETVAIELTPRMRLMPPVRILARIERQPDLPRDPVLFLRWSMPAAGALARFAAPMLSYFKSLPRGIGMDGDVIAVDLRELLRARGLEDVLGFVHGLAVLTRPGGFVARFELGI